MLDLVSPKVECVECTEIYGRFVMEPLEAGFGLTVGNSLRRVLLSSLPGTAVTSVKIDGVQHEFSSLPNVKEDVSELLLNVKSVRLRAVHDRQVKLQLDVAGPGEVTAADITLPGDIEVVNPELHLATLDSPDGHLGVEFTVERGKGYIPAGQREGLPIGVIPVDSIFTPIRKVNYRVEHTRVGQVTNYDRLVLEVWTDGTISPQEAVSQSAKILVQYLDMLVDLAKAPSRLPERQTLTAVTIPPRIYETPIEDLDLSVRAYNCLKRSGITKVGQVLEMSEEDLLAVRNFGRKSLDELREKLAEKGFLAAVPQSSLSAASEESEAASPAPAAESAVEGDDEEDEAEEDEGEDDGEDDDEDDDDEAEEAELPEDDDKELDERA